MSEPSVKAKRGTNIERVAHELEALVRAGDLTRGSRLPSEKSLAEMFGMSRPSLREALKGLTVLGLLNARSGDGTYLQPSMNSMTSRYLQWMLLLEEVKYPELYELRKIFEPAVAQLAARRATPDDIRRMRQALDEMRRSLDDPGEFIQYEMEFHDAITAAARNRAIESIMRMMYDALSEVKHRALPLVDDLERHCERHEAIFQLIADGDVAGAGRALSADVRYAQSLVVKKIRANKTGTAARSKSTAASKTGLRPGSKQK